MRYTFNVQVGNDSFGHRTVENLKDNGVDASKTVW